MALKTEAPLDAAAQYDALGLRAQELRVHLTTSKHEISKILMGLGELVASGASPAKYRQQTARLAELRGDIEALEAGVVYTTNQRELLRRFNELLRSRRE